MSKTSKRKDSKCNLIMANNAEFVKTLRDFLTEDLKKNKT